VKVQILRCAQDDSTIDGDRMPHGKICYLEIPAITVEASADFYRSIFDWKIRQRGDGATAFDDTGGVSGTWVKESDRTPDERTRVYIMVDDIADALKKISAQGGRVMTARTEIGAGHGCLRRVRRSGGERVRAV
jgi:predicted enzyme related to lactoylglutathione lyase